jgi:hypothetical protein|tara:strand:+ start:908 stop:1696 length:789 start_codon:yes stop_codon:yes gene_type:complete
MEPNFAEVQKTFTAHMRDPTANPGPTDIEDRRLQIYRDLVFNNIESLIAGSFPVLKTIYPAEQWKILIRAFVRDHISHTPHFPKMPQEFLMFLKEQEQLEHPFAFPFAFPFTMELAHYEWLELAIDLDTRNITHNPVSSAEAFIDQCPVINPISTTVGFSWPVHEIGPDFLPTEAPELPTYIVVYRNSELKTGFMELNPLAAMLIDKISTKANQTGKDILLQISREIGHTNPDVVIQGGCELMYEMAAKHILLGTHPKQIKT